MQHFIQKGTRFGLSLFLLAGILAGFLALSGPQTAYAATTPFAGKCDGSSSTTLVCDPNTGLEWLKLTETVGQSYDYVSSQLGTGGIYEGYRYASNAEAMQFLADAGINGSTYFDPANLAPANAIFPIIGVTLVSSPYTISAGFTADAAGGGTRSIAILQANGSGAWRYISNTTSNDTTYGSWLVVIPPECSPGTYVYGSDCVPADPGYYVDVAGATSETPCPVGTYQDQAGSTSCKTALAGSYVSTTGATSATLCPVGTYQDQTGATSCTPAPAGSYVSTPGAALATLCPVGTYQDLAGAISCKLADPGYYVGTAGAIAQTLCPAGTFQPSSGSTGCDPANSDHFVAIVGAVSEAPCPAGYTSNAGAVACTQGDPPHTTLTLISGQGSGGYGTPDSNTIYSIQGGSSGPALITPNDPNWNLIPGTHWVNTSGCSGGSTPSCLTDQGTGQITDYTVHFTLPDGFMSPSITVQVLADNAATVLLNGTQIGQQPQAAMVDNYGTISTFSSSAASDFMAGMNILTIRNADYGLVNGVNFRADVTYTPNSPPTADAGGPYLGAVNTAIAFDGSLSSDPENDALTYAWDFGDSSSGTGITPTHSYSAAGIYTVCLTVNDGALDSVDPSCTMVVVYDPSAGFVTGSGWIDSPSGAYTADPSLTGKATFGFVSKYKKGASVPTGNTEFQFKAGDFNFHSDTYDWLVVNQGGANAQFKGSGTVNGALDNNGNAYKFMLWAGDGSPDTFRIKIWSEDNAGEHVVYDNGTDQAIGGGSIVVHKGK